jgi:uncharacterized protein (TIGR00251 family)
VSLADVLRNHAEGCILAVRAQPGAQKTAIAGIYGEGARAALKIAVHAPPVEGKANEALIGFLSERFSVPRSSVQILSGGSSRSKVLLIRGVSPSQGEATLSTAIERR